jgi:hypothetical protein
MFLVDILHFSEERVHQNVGVWVVYLEKESSGTEIRHQQDGGE